MQSIATVLSAVVVVMAMVMSTGVDGAAQYSQYIYGRDLWPNDSNYTYMPHRFDVNEHGVVTMCGALEFSVAVTLDGRVFVWGAQDSSIGNIPLHFPLDSEYPAVNVR